MLSQAVDISMRTTMSTEDALRKSKISKSILETEKIYLKQHNYPKTIEETNEEELEFNNSNSYSSPYRSSLINSPKIASLLTVYFNFIYDEKQYNKKILLAVNPNTTVKHFVKICVDTFNNILMDENFPVMLSRENFNKYKLLNCKKSGKPNLDLPST